MVGIQHPDRGLGFISVMGMLGEHYAVSVYRGAKGLYDFWNMQKHAMKSEADGSPIEAFLEMSHVQLSFEDRDMLTDEDRSLIKKLGLKYRGRQEWPMFRSYGDGQFPWYLDAQEALFLTVGLERLKTLPVRRERFEMDVFLLPNAVRENKGGRTRIS